MGRRREATELVWPGKAEALALARRPSEGRWLPCPGEGVGEATSGNLFIEGDNLEALRLLQTSHRGAIRLVLIDPPYNTGRRFTYPDRQGGRGRCAHAAWLDLMAPRLALARDLLSPDGVLVMHLDEHEQAHAALLLAELFGEANVLGAAVWDKRNPKGDAVGLAYQHESVFFVARDRDALRRAGGLRRRKKGAEAMLAKAAQLFARVGQTELPADLAACAARYGLPEAALAAHRRPVSLDQANAEFAAWLRSQDLSGGERAYDRIDPSGEVIQAVSMAWPNKKAAPPSYFAPLVHPGTGQPCPVPARGWRNPPETMARLLAAGEILFGPDHTTQPRRKYRLRETLEGNLPSVLAYGGSDDARLAGLGIPFDHPKPLELTLDLIDAVLGEAGTVLDFFAGSGTTGHAVMARQARGRGRASFILVQEPGPLDPADPAQAPAAAFCARNGLPATLAELTKARLRRAGSALAREHPDSGADLGFRVCRIAGQS